MPTKKSGRGVDRKGRSKTNGQFVPIPYSMARSPAWRSLSGSATKVYVELHSRFHGGNNGQLTLSMDEGARLLGMSKATVKAAFDELQENGFVVRTKPGFWYGRKASEYAVTDKALNGYPPTNAWQHWKP